MNFDIGEQEELHPPPEELYLFSEMRLHKNDIPSKIVINFKRENTYLAFVSFHTLRWINRSAYITFYVEPGCRGRGIGKKCLKTAIDFAFRTLNLRRLSAEVYSYNKVSANLLKDLGFVCEGRLRSAKFHNEKYYDILVFGLLKKDWKGGGGDGRKQNSHRGR